MCWTLKKWFCRRHYQDNSYALCSGCSIITWITRERKVQLRSMQHILCLESLWIMAKRWETWLILSWPDFVMTAHSFTLWWSCTSFQGHRVSVVREEQLEGTYLCFPSVLHENRCRFANANTLSLALSQTTLLFYLCLFVRCWRRCLTSGVMFLQTSNPRWAW